MFELNPDHYVNALQVVGIEPDDKRGGSVVVFTNGDRWHTGMAPKTVVGIVERILESYYCS